MTKRSARPANPEFSAPALHASLEAVRRTPYNFDVFERFAAEVLPRYR